MRRLDPRLAQDVGLLGPALAPAVEPRSMNGLSSLIWVTCSWMAAHLRVERIARDVDPGRDRLVRDEHLRGVRLDLGDLLGRRVLGRPQKPAGRARCIRSCIARRTEAGIACS